MPLLLDSEEGTVKGSRHISPDKTKESIKTEINTVLNAVRDAPGISVDEEQYVDVPSKPSSPRLSAPATCTAAVSTDINRSICERAAAVSEKSVSRGDKSIKSDKRPASSMSAA